MTIEQLKYIVEIGKTGSLKAAAEQLHITLPALSQSIKQLEKNSTSPSSIVPEGARSRPRKDAGSSKKPRSSS
ncbi:LysR family transcriptional regulator [Rossellomorea sp. H39__3]